MSENKSFQQFNTAFGRQILALGALMVGLFCAPQGALADFRSIVDIGIYGDLYFVRENTNNGQAFANILIDNNWKTGRLFLDVGAGGLIGQSGHTYVKAPQFYYQYGKGKGARLYLGRWRSQWSFVDEYFNLGLAQPVFLWDAARPQTQGLTGLFFDIPNFRPFRITLFASYTFIPTQGATYELVDGNLISSNPWFSAPIEAVSFSGEVFDLNYDIQTPPATDIIFQPAFGAKFAYNEQDTGGFFKAFYLNKPRNELILPFEGLLNISTFNGDITVRPQVARHQIAGGDVGWRHLLGEFLLSYVHEGKIEFTSTVGTTFPELPAQDVIAGATRFDLSRSHQIWLAYMKVNREPTTVRGVYAGSNIDVFEERNRFEEAARFEWLGRYLKKDGVATVTSRFAYTFDTEDQASWVSTGLQWWVSPGLELTGQCDFFGSAKEVIAGGDFIDKFQNNDRCLVGGLYAF